MDIYNKWNLSAIEKESFPSPLFDTNTRPEEEDLIYLAAATIGSGIGGGGGGGTAAAAAAVASASGGGRAICGARACIVSCCYCWGALLGPLLLRTRSCLDIGGVAVVKSEYFLHA